MSLNQDLQYLISDFWGKHYKLIPRSSEGLTNCHKMVLYPSFSFTINCATQLLLIANKSQKFFSARNILVYLWHNCMADSIASIYMAGKIGRASCRERV